MREQSSEGKLQGVPIRGSLIHLALTAVALQAALVASIAMPSSLAVFRALVIGSAVLHFGFVVSSALTLGGRRELGWLLFTFGILFWFLYPAANRMFSESPVYEHAVAIDATHRHFLSALIGVLLFSLMFQIGYLFSLSPRARGRIANLLGKSERPVQKHLRLSAGLTALSALGFMLMSGGPVGYLQVFLAGRTSNPIWQNVGNAGTAFTPVNIFLTAVGVVAGVFAGYLAVSGRVRGQRRLLGFACWTVPILWAAMVSGTRATLLLVVAPPILLVARERIRAGGGFKASTVAALVGALLVLTVASNVIRQFRAHATFEGELELELKDSDFFTNTALAMAIAERENRLLYDSSLLQIVTLPIPRVLWRGTPASKSVPLFTLYVWGPTSYLRGKTNLPSIIGQYRLSWGWFGICVAGLTIGVIIRLADDLVRHRAHLHVRLASLLVVMFVFISFRVVGNSGASVLFMLALYLTLVRLKLSSSSGQQRTATASVGPATSRAKD